MSTLLQLRQPLMEAMRKHSLWPSYADALLSSNGGDHSYLIRPSSVTQGETYMDRPAQVSGGVV